MGHHKQACSQWQSPPHPGHCLPGHTCQQASDAALTTSSWRSMTGFSWDTRHLDTPSYQTPPGLQRWQGQPRQPPSSLALTDMDLPSWPDDFQEQQDAARDYEPTLEGPNVSPRRSTQELVARYASSNGAYTLKTEALNLTHSEFRTVIGDGNCGWRAVFFTFCEILLLIGDVQNIQRHHRRLQTEAQNIRLISDAFMEVYGDSSEELEDLFNRMPGWLSSANPVFELEKFFNQESRTVHMIFCLRLLTSGHMRANRDSYEAFLEVPFEAYCTNVIEKPNEEIEEQGLKALCDMLLARAGIGLQVINLHNNPGSAPDCMTYHKPLHPAYGGPFNEHHPPEVQVLYTPDHYDIIYQSFQDAGIHGNGARDFTVNAVTDVPCAGHYSEIPSMSLGQPDDVNLLSWFPPGFLPQGSLQPLVNNDETVFSIKESAMDFSPDPGSFGAKMSLTANNASLLTPMATPSPSQGLVLPQRTSSQSRPLFTYTESPRSLSSRHHTPCTDLPAADRCSQIVPNPPQACRGATSMSQPNPRKREKQVLSLVHWNSSLNVGHFLNEDFDPLAPGIGLTPKDYNSRSTTPKKVNKRKAKNSDDKGCKTNSRRKK